MHDRNLLYVILPVSVIIDSPLNLLLIDCQYITKQYLNTFKLTYYLINIKNLIYIMLCFKYLIMIIKFVFLFFTFSHNYLESVILVLHFYLIISPAYIYILHLSYCLSLSSLIHNQTISIYSPSS